MKLVITGPPQTTSQLSSKLYRYFTIKEEPGSGPCAIDVVVDYDRGRPLRMNLCNFLPTEKIPDILTMFWFKFRVSFPQSATPTD